MEKEIISISLHPNKPLEYPYEEYEIRADRFLPLKISDANTTDKGVHITADMCHISVESPYDNVMRMRFAGKGLPEKTVAEEYGMILDRGENAKLDSTITENTVTCKNASMSLVYDIKTNEFRISDNADNTLLQTKKGGVRFTLDAPEYSGDKSLTYFELDSEEEIFGFGGRIIHPNRKGTSVDVFDEKGGKLFGDYGGFPMPFFLSTKGYGVFLANPWPHVYFDMGKTNKDEWYFYTPGGDCDLYVIKGDDFRQIVETYTAMTGRNLFPDKWHLGFWCSSVQFPTAEYVTENLLRMHEEGYPAEAAVIDGCWRAGPLFADKYTRSHTYMASDYEWHEDFGDGKKMIETLMEKNIKTVLHINSCAFKRSTIEYAVKNGLLREIIDGAVAELATEKGREFYESLLTPIIEDGMIQWWTDHADRINGEIKQGLPSRNIFGFLWNKLISEVMAKHGIDNHMCLSRGGGIGSQRYAIPWPGDTAFGIDRYEEDIWFMLSAGLCGFGMQSVDLGGFSRPLSYADASRDEVIAVEFDPETVARRICQSILFVPVPRIHNGDVCIPKFPWHCPEETRGLYKECLFERYRLTPYIYSYAIESHLSGAPILRPLVYHHMSDKNVYSIGNEFYMGEYMLFAPVTTEGAVSRNVYLPEGEWINYWTGEEYSGNTTITVDAPLLEMQGLPIFVKKGGVIVKQDESLTLTNDIPAKLYIDFYTDDKATISLHEAQNVVNTFSVDNGELYLENNTDIEREYVVSAYGKKEVIKLESNSNIKTNI